MAATAEMPRLKVRYNDEVAAKLKSELGIDNVMDVPKFEKIVINMSAVRPVSPR